MTGPRPAAILWDWDNTLVDGWGAIAEGLNAAFSAFGLPEWTLAEVKGRVRRSLRESFPELFGTGWEAAREVFYASVRARHLEVLRPMPGAEAAVRAALARGIPQGVVSNKQGALLRAEAAHLGWAPWFRVLVGAGDAAADKPDPAPFRLALSALGVPAEPALGFSAGRAFGAPAAQAPGAPAGLVLWYVGDTALDMQAARAFGATAVLLGDAAHDGGVAAAAPDRHFPDGAALAAWLAGGDQGDPPGISP